MKNVLILGLSIILWFSTSCQRSEQLSPELQELGRATGKAEPQASLQQQSVPSSAAQPSNAKKYSGEVLEAIEASRYTYLHIKLESGEPIWAAVPQAKIDKGQQITVIESVVMENFQSPTLKRTFPSIVFGILAGPKSGTTLPKGHPPLN